ncbi:hypothetical protein LJY25_04045 [Hymenobacter sp. BT175]|uniref:hypothetical protein n=1 Tax=Hymenobacter translucens TaxID=2886507 RepID=UPI001D0DD49A|nr:hypothetical protein [Hymenobacter translucens]MCC2545604.1 hypothetical protein [Hymenobacter translucens]
MTVRRFISDSTPVGAVRRFFGLSQTELSLFLDVGKAIIGHVESGRRDLSLTLHHRLLPLLRHLPATPPERGGSLALPATAPVPAPGPLEARRDQCRRQAVLLRWDMEPLVARAVYAARWQQALPTVLAELLAPDSGTDKAWLEDLRPWLERLPNRFRPQHAADYHLLRLRAEALEAEAAAIDALLAERETPAQ